MFLVNIHMSDPKKDCVNDAKRRTLEYDSLCRIKPLMGAMWIASRAYYHPYRTLSIDERMMASKAISQKPQYIKAKPVKWGFKLVVLADSSDGYTIDISVYTGKSNFSSGNRHAYDAVMRLIQPSYLGTGYHL
ncbi:unnamed protein product [Coregonus sp. 'balchen']|nr:unnamed protein product [Coregonus sp. 'balchen']